MKSLETPKIDVKTIQERANAAAEKAYLKEIEEYYTSYSSPYRKLIKQELEKQEFSYGMKLPNILTKLNQALSKEVDKIANNAVASTFIPMISKTLIGYEKELKFSFILEEIIKKLEPEREEFDEFSFDYEKRERWGWLSCTLYTPKNNYEFTLHTVDIPKSGKQKYQLLSFPRNKHEYGYNSNMIIYKDDVKIEMPFTPSILEDKVLNVFFKIMLGGSKITMDCDGFNEDMFPQEEYCNC